MLQKYKIPFPEASHCPFIINLKDPLAFGMYNFHKKIGIVLLTRTLKEKSVWRQFFPKPSCKTSLWLLFLWYSYIIANAAACQLQLLKEQEITSRSLFPDIQNMSAFIIVL